jgi:hypothetical protein
LESSLEDRSAGADLHELDVGAQHFLQRAEHNIDPLLFHHAADAAKLSTLLESDPSCSASIFRSNRRKFHRSLHVAGGKLLQQHLYFG